jgi:hypothetical protein
MYAMYAVWKRFTGTINGTVAIALSVRCVQIYRISIAITRGEEKCGNDQLHPAIIMQCSKLYICKCLFKQLFSVVPNAEEVFVSPK